MPKVNKNMKTHSKCLSFSGSFLFLHCFFIVSPLHFFVHFYSFRGPQDCRQSQSHHKTREGDSGVWTSDEWISSHLYHFRAETERYFRSRTIHTLWLRKSQAGPTNGFVSFRFFFTAFLSQTAHIVCFPFKWLLLLSFLFFRFVHAKFYFYWQQ